MAAISGGAIFREYSSYAGELDTITRIFLIYFRRKMSAALDGNGLALGEVKK